MHAAHQARPDLPDQVIAVGGLIWTIDGNIIASWARRYDAASKADRRYMRRDWRCQEAKTLKGRWRISQPSGGDGTVELNFAPPESGPILKCRHVELAGREIGRFASEAEARLAVAYYESNRADATDPESFLLGKGYALQQEIEDRCRIFAKPVKGGRILVVLRTADTNERGWRFGRSVDVDYSPNRGSRWYNIAFLEDLQVQPKFDGTAPVRPAVPHADPFVADVVAAVSVAEARLAANGPGRGMTKPLMTGQEDTFIAGLAAISGS